MGSVNDNEYLMNGDKFLKQALNYEHSFFTKFDAYLVDRIKKIVEAKNWFLKISPDNFMRRFKIELCDDYLKEYNDKIKPALESGIKIVKNLFDNGFYGDSLDWIKAVKALATELNDYFNTDTYSLTISQCEWYEEKIKEIYDDFDENAQYRAYKQADDLFRSILYESNYYKNYDCCMSRLDEVYALLKEAGDYPGVDQLYEEIKEAEEEWEEDLNNTDDND